MVKFCNFCKNILHIRYTNEDIIFICNACNEIHEKNDDDTLIYRKNYHNEFDNFEDILHNSKYDDVIKKEFKKCISCTNDIVKHVRVGNSMKLFNICTKCEEIWLN